MTLKAGSAILRGVCLEGCGRNMDRAFDPPPRLGMRVKLSEGFDKDCHKPEEDSSNSQKGTPFQKSRGQGTREKGKWVQELIIEKVSLGTLPDGLCFLAHHKGLLRMRQHYLAGVPREVGWARL
jgi:hypothetical protein